MKRFFFVSLLLLSIMINGFGQEVSELFLSSEPINIQVTGSVKSIKKNTNDSTFVTRKFRYEESPNKWTEVPTEARTRGNFRLKYCYFPPIKLKFNKEDVQSTIFKGNKALKLVFPCQTSKNKNELVRKEYLCYKFYEILGPHHFKTRLANISLTEVSKKKPRQYELLGFFVEDNSAVGKRGNAKLVELKVGPQAFEEANTVRNDYFQYMIGNADWSAIYQHNSNVLLADGKYIPLPYDFDMSGFVDAHYAHQNAPTLGTGNPRDRVYRGFCKSPAVMEEIRQEFLGKESAIHGLINEQQKFFQKAELDDMHSYLEGFFKILKKDDLFQEQIMKTCR
jgi:hypothetical protein